MRSRAVLGMLVLVLALLTGAGCASAPKLVLDTPVDGGSAVRWLAGDSLLAVALLGRGVAIFDSRTGEERAAWRMDRLPDHAVHGLAASAGGETLAVATQDSVRVLLARDGALLMAAPGGGVSLALSGDGRTLAWSDGTLGRVLDATTGRMLWQGRMLAGRNALVWAPDQAAFAWTDGRDVTLMGGDSTNAGRLGPFLEAEPRELAFSQSGRTLAVAEATESVSFWDTRAEKLRWRLALGGRARVEHIALSGDTWYLATEFEGRARLLWAYTGRRVADWSPHRGAGIRDLAFSPDGRRLATIGADGHLKIWAVPPPKQGGR